MEQLMQYWIATESSTILLGLMCLVWFGFIMWLCIRDVKRFTKPPVTAPKTRVLPLRVIDNPMIQ
jgi:hypothetical protein